VIDKTVLKSASCLKSIERGYTDMNRPEHMVAGGLTAAAAYLYRKNLLGEKPDLGGLFAIAGIGALAGALPDMLEPATSPHHRSTFHSVGLGIFGLMAFRTLMPGGLPNQQLETVLKAFGLAYCSHLVLDATTPMSLPLLRRGF
jgi:membrane-bound metal-dependent hydrolase YbcI (DUF457 family)